MCRVYLCWSTLFVDVIEKQGIDILTVEELIKMLLRRKKGKPLAKKESEGHDKGDECLKQSEKMMNELLSPWEPYIMTLQSLLVWENPQHTAILFVAINVLFW